MNLLINCKEIKDVSFNQLQTALNEIDNEEFCEVWLNVEDSAAICLLKNSNRCWLVYFRENGDSGFSTRNLLSNSTKEIEVTLSNGQQDFYPESWFISYESGKKALEFFFETQEMDSKLTWNEN